MQECDCTITVLGSNQTDAGLAAVAAPLARVAFTAPALASGLTFLPGATVTLSNAPRIQATYRPPIFGFRVFIASCAGLPEALACPAVPPAAIAHSNRFCANGHVHNLIAANAVFYENANGCLISRKANLGRKAMSCRLLERLHARKLLPP